MKLMVNALSNIDPELDIAFKAVSAAHVALSP